MNFPHPHPFSHKVTFWGRTLKLSVLTCISEPQLGSCRQGQWGFSQNATPALQKGRWAEAVPLAFFACFSQHGKSSLPAWCSKGDGEPNILSLLSLGGASAQ